MDNNIGARASSRAVGAADGVKSAGRTLDVLEFLGTTRAQPTLTEMATALGLPKSSLHKLLATMERRGWIESDPATHTRYRIGLHALLAGSRYVDADEVVRLTETALTRLSGKFNEATHLGRLDGTDIVYLAKRESTHQLRMFSAVGRRLPAHATAMGKAILATMAWDEVEQLLPSHLVALTDQTITTHDQLRVEIGKVRDQGFAVDDQESADMLRAVAVALPVIGGTRNAISIAAPAGRLKSEQLAEMADALTNAIDSLSLGSALFQSSQRSNQGGEYGQKTPSTPRACLPMG